MKTIAHPKDLTHKSKASSFAVLFTYFVMFFFSTTIYPHTAEFRMHVGNVTTFWPATVELYSLNSYLKYSGASENIPRGETINGAVVNFVADITDMQSNTTDPSMPPVAPGSYY